MAEAAVRRVETLDARDSIDGVDDARIERAARAVKDFRLGDGLFERVRGIIDFGAALLAKASEIAERECA